MVDEGLGVGIVAGEMAREERQNEGQDRHSEADKLGPGAHAAEHPGERAELDGYRPNGGLLQRMEGKGGAEVAFKLSKQLVRRRWHREG